MSDFKNSLAYLIANQVPDYIRDEFPQFVLFLEKYYEFLDQDGQANEVLLNASSFSDINNTLEQFLPSFREQYLQMFPNNSLVNDRRLIKFIREFYEAKGSEESIHFIFRAFFNEHVDIIYPSQYVLKPSDGVWLNRQKMRIITDDTISLDPFQLKGKRANIYSHLTIGSVDTFETHDITVQEVTRLAYSTVPTYELYVKHEDPNSVIILPGAGANARPLIVNGQIKAVTGDPTVHSRYFDPGINSETYVLDAEAYFAEDYLETTESAVSLDYARIFIPDHGFTTGDCVIYDPMLGAPIGGLIPYRQYYVKAIDNRYFQLYRDRIALQQVPQKKFVTSANVNVSNNTITIPSHGYKTGDMIVYRADSTPIGGLNDRQVYYAIKIDNNTIKLAETLIDSDPRYCLDDTYFAEDYVTLSSYNELDITDPGVGNYHVFSKEYFINFTNPGTGAQQRFISAMDASGSGYNAIPDVSFISEIGGTGAIAEAHLDANGGIEYVSVSASGSGYNDASTIISFSTDAVRSFVYIGDFTSRYGYVSRSITDTVEILSVSGGPTYGFLQGEIYGITESGSSGQYVYNFPDTSLNYFAGDYVQFGIDNKASVIIDSVDETGKPTKVRIFSTGSGFEAETFTTTITSSTGASCVLRFRTGAITTIQEGYQNRQGMLSDVNHLQDNYYYQNYSYVLRSKVPSVNWMTMIKNTVHPAGMAVFSELLIRATIDMGASFEVTRQPIHFYEFPIEVLSLEENHTVFFVKSLADTYTTNDYHSADVGKILSDVSNGFTEEVINDVGKGVVDITTSLDSIDFFDFGKSLLDIPITSDDLEFRVRKTVVDSNSAILDSSVTDFYKYLDKTVDTAAPYVLSDYFAEDYITSADIVLSAIDNADIDVSKGLTETIAAGDSIPYMVITKAINDAVTVTEQIKSIDPVYTIPNDDPKITDIAETHLYKVISDGVLVSDNNTIATNKVSSDALPHGINEDLNIAVPGKGAESILHVMEHTYTDTSKNLAEAAVASDSGVINIQDYWSENYTAGAYVGTEYTF